MAGFVQHLHYRQLDAEEDAIRLMLGVDTSLQFPESPSSMVSEDLLYHSTLPYIKASYLDRLSMALYPLFGKDISD